ncbi:MAG: hypothetical protein R2744_01270 [Bacteroidales bacterium]
MGAEQELFEQQAVQCAGNVEVDSLMLLDYRSGEGRTSSGMKEPPSMIVALSDYGAGLENALYRNSTFRKFFLMRQSLQQSMMLPSGQTSIRCLSRHRGVHWPTGSHCRPD